MEEGIDLNAIADFMNSTEVVEESDKNEIENTLDYINNQLAEAKPQIKDITTKEQIEKQEHSIDELTDIALQAVGKIDGNTDEIYNLFFKDIAIGKDRSDVSKQSLLDSQRIKVEMVNALAGLANAKAKLEMAKAKVQAGPAGVFVQAQSGADVGISLHNLYESCK